MEDFGTSQYDADVLTSDRHLAAYFESAVNAGAPPKSAANWIISEILKELNSRSVKIQNCPVKSDSLAELIGAVNSGIITGSSGKTVLAEMFSTGKKASVIIQEMGLAQISDESQIADIAAEVVAEFPSQVKEFLSGKEKVLQFLIGQVMKKSKGKANPQTATKLLTEKINAVGKL
jgi:aspartyl-tRNA(Asn)/glutamyl-tRNA(Gln) amidotransferase subunit B